MTFLSGDVHTAWALELKRRPGDPDERPAAVEVVTASITSENLDEVLGAGPQVVDLARTGLEALLGVYKFIAWSRDNDFLSMREALQKERRRTI